MSVVDDSLNENDGMQSGEYSKVFESSEMYKKITWKLSKSLRGANLNYWWKKFDNDQAVILKDYSPTIGFIFVGTILTICLLILAAMTLFFMIIAIVSDPYMWGGVVVIVVTTLYFVVLPVLCILLIFSEQYVIVMDKHTRRIEVVKKLLFFYEFEKSSYEEGSFEVEEIEKMDWKKIFIIIASLLTFNWSFLLVWLIFIIFYKSRRLILRGNDGTIVTIFKYEKPVFKTPLNDPSVILQEIVGTISNFYEDSDVLNPQKTGPGAAQENSSSAAVELTFAENV